MFLTPTHILSGMVLQPTFPGRTERNTFFFLKQNKTSSVELRLCPDPLWSKIRWSSSSTGDPGHNLDSGRRWAANLANSHPSSYRREAQSECSDRPRQSEEELLRPPHPPPPIPHLVLFGCVPCGTQSVRESGASLRRRRRGLASGGIIFRDDIALIHQN